MGLPLGRHEHEGPRQGRRAPKPEQADRRPVSPPPLPSGLGHHAHYRLLQYYLFAHWVGHPPGYGLYGPRNRAPSWPSDHPRLVLNCSCRARGPCGQAGSITVVGDVCARPRCLSGRTSRRTTAREPLFPVAEAGDR
jgi:hypothetical protein